jgi:hypothetical protein
MVPFHIIHKADNQTQYDQTDTALTSLPYLLRRKDVETAKVFNDMMAEAKPSGVNWTSLVAIVKVVLDEAASPALAAGLRCAVEKGLGRHDDGDRATVLRAYARCGASLDELESASKAHGDVREACERAAVVAAVVELESADGDELARAALRSLLARKPFGSMEFGAATALLRALRAHEREGFEDESAAVLALGRAGKWANAELLAWLAADASGR